MGQFIIKAGLLFIYIKTHKYIIIYIFKDTYISKHILNTLTCIPGSGRGMTIGIRD